MSIRQHIYEVLRASIGDASMAVIHSSLPHLMPPEDVGKWDFLYALRMLARDGVTIAIPAFTFSWCGGKDFHHVESASEVGVFGDWALDLEGFKRVNHPIYSFVVGGPQAAELLAADRKTAFGKKSIFAVFEKCDAKVVMFGCGWDYCTLFHHYEEEAQVPYRYLKDFRGNVIAEQGAREEQVAMFVRNLEIGAENDFTPVEMQLRARGDITSIGLWKGAVEAASSKDIAKACRKLLKANSLALVEKEQEIEHTLSCRGRSLSNPRIRVAVLGSANLALVEEALLSECRQHLQDRQVELYSPPYGQVGREVFDTSSSLYEFDAHYTVFLNRMEDLVGAPGLATVDVEAAVAALDSFIQQVKAYVEQGRSQVIVTTFSVQSRTALGSADGKEANGLSKLIEKANARLVEELQDLSGVHLFNMADALARYSGPPATDARLWFLGRFPFGKDFSEFLAKQFCAMILAFMGRTARLIVLDLDDTLWGGVLGEDGLTGLQLGGDYPGNAFKAFQDLLLRYSERGIALAVSSKNDEAQALEAMEKLDGMSLRPSHLVAHRVNWRPKWENVGDICNELNLGLESVLFVDNSPTEREQMRQMLPGVHVLDLPEDPALYADALLSSPLLECVELTKEDRKRVDSYRARSQISQQRSMCTNLDEFYASLNTKLHIASLNETNLSRALQLIKKTNQFNTTTQRYDRHDLERLIANGHSVFVIGAEDRFNPFENIGVIVVDWGKGNAEATVLSYLLSCRVLGRGVETGVLYWLMEHARKRNAEKIFGRIVETERNAPAQSVFSDAGFSQSKNNGEWVCQIKDAAALPAWLEVVDHTLTEGDVGGEK